MKFISLFAYPNCSGPQPWYQPLCKHHPCCHPGPRKLGPQARFQVQSVEFDGFLSKSFVCQSMVSTYYQKEFVQNCLGMYLKWCIIIWSHVYTWSYIYMSYRYMYIIVRGTFISQVPFPSSPRKWFSPFQASGRPTSRHRELARCNFRLKFAPFPGHWNPTRLMEEIPNNQQGCQGWW